MKRILAVLGFVLICFTVGSAQGNGNCGNGNGNSGNNGNGNSGWAAYWPQNVITWLENGGQVPMPLVVAVIHEARSWGQQNFGLNQGQMLVKYLQGALTIEYVPTAPPALVFKVSFGGGTAIVLLENF